jgi:chromosome segregation ATPase
MFGSKTRQLEAEKRKLNWELERMKNDIRLLEEEVEEIKVSRRKWRDRASNLRRERRHLVQEIKLQTQGTNQ